MQIATILALQKGVARVRKAWMDSKRHRIAQAAGEHRHVDMGRLQGTLAQVAPAFNMKTTPSAGQIYTDKYLPPRSEILVAIPYASRACR